MTEKYRKRTDMVVKACEFRGEGEGLTERMNEEKAVVRLEAWLKEYAPWAQVCSIVVGSTKMTGVYMPRGRYAEPIRLGEWVVFESNGVMKVWPSQYFKAQFEPTEEDLSKWSDPWRAPREPEKARGDRV